MNHIPDQPTLLTIAILGGTGKEGKGLAYRWAKASYRVLIGSRTPEKAQVTTQELKTLLTGTSMPFCIEGMSNLDAASKADIRPLAKVVSVP